MHHLGSFQRINNMSKYKRFKIALSNSWGKDTAYRKDAEHWTKENPALGQCAVTALLFNELFGGKIYSGISENGIVHYWNRKAGIKIDLTKQQFSEKLHFKNVKRWNREDLLATGNVAIRYAILRDRVLSAMKE